MKILISVLSRQQKLDQALIQEYCLSGLLNKPTEALISLSVIAIDLIV